MGGSAAPNSAKSAASNMMPMKARMKKFRCHFENGNRSSLATSSADFVSSTPIGLSPNEPASTRPDSFVVCRQSMSFWIEAPQQAQRTPSSLGGEVKPPAEIPIQH